MTTWGRFTDIILSALILSPSSLKHTDLHRSVNASVTGRQRRSVFSSIPPPTPPSIRDAATHQMRGCWRWVSGQNYVGWHFYFYFAMYSSRRHWWRVRCVSSGQRLGTWEVTCVSFRFLLRVKLHSRESLYATARMQVHALFPNICTDYIISWRRAGPARSPWLWWEARVVHECSLEERQVPAWLTQLGSAILHKCTEESYFHQVSIALIPPLYGLALK